MKNETILRKAKALRKEIRDVNSFTITYWTRQLYEWRDNSLWMMEAPRFGELCEDLIRNRNSYTTKLKKRLKTYVQRTNT